MYHVKHKWIGGVLLIAGTTIGGGMLALPVSTGLSGLFPALCLLIGYWLFMTFTAFLFLEVNLWMGKESNLISMAHYTLGRAGEAISWILYLFLLYSLTTAYIAGSSPIFLAGLEFVFGTKLPAWVGPLPLLLLFGSLVYLGTESVDFVNRLLMIGLIVSYSLIIAFLSPMVEVSQLAHMDWSMFFFGISIVSISFGFHIVIPSLTTYLEGDVKILRKVIWIGSAIPLLVYIFWEIISLGIVPQGGECGLIEGYIEGSDVIQLIVGCLQKRSLRFLAHCLAFFAILTSFLGVSLSLSDFLSDGLKIQKKGGVKWFLYCLTFAPPLFFTWIDPHAFINALRYAGAFGVVILLALMPTLMVWAGRYRHHYKGPFVTWGGKPALFCSLLLCLFVIAVEVAHQVGWLVLLRGE